MNKKFLIAIFILLIAIIVSLYVVGIVVQKKSPGEDIFRTLAVVFVCLGGIVRVSAKSGRRKSLSFFEKSYEPVLKQAFLSSPKDRKRLLRAIRDYNESRYEKAAKQLLALRLRCQKRDDHEAVNIFLALCFTDMGLLEEAISVYQGLIAADITSSTIYSNLGSLYSQLGKYDDARANMHLALQNDPENEFAYNNLAKLYFDHACFEKAKEYAKKALAINHKFRQASSLLAIIYHLEENQEECEKYMHQAIASGADPDAIKAAFVRYRAEGAFDQD